MDYDKLIERLRNWDGVKPDREIGYAIDGLKTLRAENEKLRAYANDAYGTMYNMYGAGGKYCDEKILAFWRRWNGKKEDA